jgi:hypothetical protein
MIRSAFIFAAAWIAASFSLSQPIFAEEETDQRLDRSFRDVLH